MTTTELLERITSQTIDTLNQRVSIRDYNDRPLDDDTLLTLLNAARRTATSSNTQTYSFVVVRNADTKRKLAHLAGDQKHVIDCPVFVAVCADITRIGQAAATQGGELAANLEVSMISIIDAALAGQSLSLAAESIGLGTVMIGGIRNHPQEAAEVLGLPDGVFIVYGLCIGWYDEKPAQKPRFAPETIIHHEQYRPASAADLTTYDHTLAQHSRDQGRTSPDEAWSGVIGKRFQNFQRSFLRAVLERRGFRFD